MSEENIGGEEGIIEERRKKLEALRSKKIAYVNDFYKEHYASDIHSENEELIDYIWKRLRRIVIDNGFHEEMMRGATFYHFVDFYKKYMCIY